MGAVTGAPDAPPAAATDSLAALQVGEARARDGAADRAERSRADEEARRSIPFTHVVAGRGWTVHVAPSTAGGHLQDEGFDGEPDRAAMEGWVAANRAMLERSAERKIAGGAVTGDDVWVHSRDFA
ncbi:hypothetical protein [Sphingomonas sp.]|uniref:hypothetical protein n=1 Tax=Sphingomonas sp. TaxID=28214 RepID=UPI003AFFF721